MEGRIATATSPSPSRWMPVILASSDAWAAASSTPRWSEMNDAGVGTGGTNFAMAPPVGVLWGSTIMATRSSQRMGIGDGIVDQTARNREGLGASAGGGQKP